MRQKQENAYLVENSSIISTKKRSNTEEAAAILTSFQHSSANKKQKTDLQLFVERIENLNLPYSNQQWGSLLFYSGKELVYTHYLWGEGPSRISQDTLLNVKVPAKFRGVSHVNIESLVEDFRFSLGEGFTLTRNKDNVSYVVV